MDGDIAHELKDFHKFPWEKMDNEWFENCGGPSLGGIHGGVDFNEPIMRWHIAFFIDPTGGSIAREYWEIPVQLYKLLLRYEEDGKEDLRVDLRHLLGVSKSD